MIIIGSILSFAFVVALGYVLLRIWRRRNGPGSTDKDNGFRPGIGFTRLDGMESLSLLLKNESNTHAWAEEVEIFLTDLVATAQTAEASNNGIRKIRQMIPPGDMLPISLAEVIYKAAGEPQRRHSSVLSSIVRYRIGENWFEKNLENYRIRMIGLTASGIQRERKPVKAFSVPEKPQQVPATETKLR
jgi:hypothetical protein